ncbi:hypothetical protein IWW54_005625, partial [Coemansia sp. RSA 2705]
MAYISLSRPRMLVALIIAGVLSTTLILTASTHHYWGLHGGASKPPLIRDEDLVLDKLAIIFPVNNNTDMQFYRNTWMRDYLYPVCDWPGPGCKIVCHRDSTYMTLDKKTICFSRELKAANDQKEFYLKIDDDTLVDMDYVVELVREYSGWRKPLFISHIWRSRDRGFPDALNRVRHGNGKFYMFNRQLVNCLNLDITYRGRRFEDTVFGGMISTGCGERNVVY